MKIKFFVLFAFAFMLFPIVNADVISLNSGGSEVIVINPDTYIEGFFGCVPTTCTVLGYNCGSWSDGCGKTLNCGTCAADYTCTAGICVYTGGGGGGGGGESGGGEKTVSVTPSSLNINMLVNKSFTQIIYVKNLKNTALTVSISQNNLDNRIIIPNSSLTLAAGETKSMQVIFVSTDEMGIFTGTISIDGVSIPVSLNVGNVLFDSNIVVLNTNYKVSQGSDLRTRVTLIPMGDSERMDVTLNYVIKDYAGKVYLTQSETVLVENKMNFRKNFGTGGLPLGKYIVGLELVYSGGVAPSSAHFEIVETTAGDFLGKIILILIFLIIVIAIIIIILIILKKRKEEQSQ